MLLVTLRKSGLFTLSVFLIIVENLMLLSLHPIFATCDPVAEVRPCSLDLSSFIQFSQYAVYRVEYPVKCRYDKE